MSNTQSRIGTSSDITQCNSSIGKCLSCDLLYDRMYEIETFEYAHAHVVDLLLKNHNCQKVYRKLFYYSSL